ncbi:response regulator [Clostridioides difficile]|uniref:response regulator n=1 Tax=Clostridioides difficile TaxID=1496 RepID=UPI000C9B6B5C|nr:response regulator transcription factor [Clostridioides difficile]HBG1535963.1 response regulator transcription factor [Clostridioides difficile]HCU2754588.1 response regulator transcription factor [Clostridioides difficile]
MEIKPLVLIVEDDKPICKFIKVSLETQNYRCIETDNGGTAISLIHSLDPDLIILDLGLPDIDGIEVIGRVRACAKTNKIIVVSAREHERDKVEALDGGADDYLTKPFSVTELLARVRVALRNKAQQDNINNDAPKSFEVKNLKIDYENHIVSINGEEIHLTPIEYKIIELMSKYSGRVLTHKFIIDKVWGNYYESENQSLRVFMASIRRKIEKNPAQPEYILTEVGVGYRMADE